MKSDNNMLTAIDLFCGCGGFSLGMIRAGFRVLGAVDFNKEAVTTARINLGTPTNAEERRHINPTIPHILERDLTTFTPEELAEIIGRREVDVIFGGPPCQGFSNARQRDGANHGSRRFIDDDRRHLYRDFLRFVGFFKPRVFVMENVLGIRSAAGGEYFTRVMHEARKLGYRMQQQTEDAYRLGVPQKRRRQLFVGVRDDTPGFFPKSVQACGRAKPHTNLGAVIADLPRLDAGAGTHKTDYDVNRRNKVVDRDDAAKHYLEHVLEIQKASLLLGHVARPHNPTDIDCFKSLREGENSATALKRDPDIWFPYNRENFKDRYTRQHRRKPCSTIVAHLSKDGLMFIHPTQDRSLTPREAARIQSFPDWFEFPEARTHAFRVIGNAVPPLVAEAIGDSVMNFLGHNLGHKRKVRAKSKSQAPKSELEAAKILEKVVCMSKTQLAKMDKADFCRAWNAVFFLFQGLHPDESDHGTELDQSIPDYYLVAEVDQRVFSPHFCRSGWPVHLVPLQDDAIRRMRVGELSSGEFYPCEAQHAGIEWRESNLVSAQ